MVKKSSIHTKFRTTRTTVSLVKLDKHRFKMKGDQKLNPNVPSFVPCATVVRSAMDGIGEDILALKLLNFEKQIEIKRRDEEIQRLKNVIAKLLWQKNFNQCMKSEP